MGETLGGGPLTTSINLGSIPPRERAGSRTLARFRYQANVATRKLIEKHESGDDYRFLFDYFDDLVILNSSSQWSTLAFFQIKGRNSGAWTTSNLCRASPGTPSTIVGKMYANIATFGSAATGARFVSNAHYSLKLNDNSKTTPEHLEVQCNDLALVERNKISAAIDKDFPSPRSVAHEPHLTFEITPLAISNSEEQVIGQLAKYFESKGHVVGVAALHQTLTLEIMTKSAESAVHTTEVSLFASKSICRADIDRLFDRAINSSKGVLDHWDVVQKELSGTLNTLDLIRLKTRCVEYMTRRAEGSAAALQFHTACLEARAALSHSIGSATSFQAVAELIGTYVANLPGFSPAQIERGALLVEAFDAIQ